MQRCWLELKAKRKRLVRLENYRRGTPPVQLGTTNAASGFYKFQRQCRTNVADLVVQALIERLGVRTVRTAASTDKDGDVQATAMLQGSGLGTSLTDVFRMLATFGEAYLHDTAPEAAGQWGRISAEDPRECIVLCDAVGRDLVAFKLFHDPIGGYDYAILWRAGDGETPGRKVIAYAERATAPNGFHPDGSLRAPRIQFAPSTFTIRSIRPEDAETDNVATPLWSEEYATPDLPLTRVVAPDGVGVFERHLDLIDQINHIILQGLVIATLQAFKQRALIADKENPPLPDTDPKTGEKINYDDLFSADPGALWELPPGWRIWESGEVNLQGILAQAKDAIQRFAAVTRTPFSMFVSDATNQSAEGAQLTREGLVFKTEDFQRAIAGPLMRAISLGFKYMPNDVRFAMVDGAQIDRADLAGMAIDWLPAERYSLQERATADASAKALSTRQRLARIWGLTPAEIDQNMSQLNEDALREQIAKATSDATAAGG